MRHLRIVPPIVGRWPGGRPELVELGGVVYRRARWRQRYPGAVDQYRADVPRDSAHLLVLGDGSYRVDHVDRFNPDAGSPLSHFLADHPLGRAVMTLGAIRLVF